MEIDFAQCDSPPGETRLSILHLEVPMVKYGGSPLLHLSPCPRHPGSACQRGGPSLAPSTPRATLSTLNSVKQHINQRPVQMSAGTSARFKKEKKKTTTTRPVI